MVNNIIKFCLKLIFLILFGIVVQLYAEQFFINMFLLSTVLILVIRVVILQAKLDDIENLKTRKQDGILKVDSDYPVYELMD